MRMKPWLAALAAAGLLMSGAALADAPLPSGERQLGRTVIEPAYDFETGELVYIMTPMGAHASAHAVSPLYLVVYPNAAANAVGTMNCAHAGGDNCPDHGPVFSDLAQSTVPAVYGDGVWGHDHLVEGHRTNAYTVARQVIVVLFTNVAAAQTHITTEEQLEAALDAGDAITIETTTVIHANEVSGATYARATPATPAQP